MDEWYKKNYFSKSFNKLFIFFLILNFIFSLFIVPLSADKARSYIRDSNVDYLPLLIKPKKFIDTVEKLTIYSDKKDENNLENIIIKDSFSSSKSKIIFSKKGYFTQKNNENFLILKNGKILNINNGKTNTFNFNQTQINLSNYSSKSIKTPKLQEVKTTSLFDCLFFANKSILLNSGDRFKFNCNETTYLKNKITQELFTRIFKPFYIPLLALISGLLLIKSKNSQGFTKYKFKIFATGVVIISMSEISNKFYSLNLIQSIMILLIPFLLFVLFYYFFKKQSNLQIS